MATNPAVPFWDEGNAITCHAAEALTGKRFVHISGVRTDGNPTVDHSVGAAGKRAFGVTARDAASGTKVTVYSAPGIVVPVTTSEAVDAGDLIYSDADGCAVDTQPSGALPAGIALDDAAQGADVPVKLF